MKLIEIEDLYRFHSLGNIVWSPDGERGMFLKWKISREDNGYEAGIWLVEDGAVRQLGDEPCTGLVCWIDPENILFSTSITSGMPCHIGSLAGKLAAVQFKKVNVHTGQSWDAFRLEKKPEKIRPAAGGVYVVQTVCENQPLDGDCLVIDELPYKSNGRGYTNKARRQLVLVSPDSGKCQLPVTSSLFETSLWEVSPDGTRILYTGILPQGVGHKYDGLYVYDITTGSTRCLIQEGKLRIDGIAFAEDHIVVAASDQRCYGMDQNPVIYRLDEDGSLKEEAFWDGPVTGSSVNSDTRYGGGETFQADGNALYFVTTHWDHSMLCCVRDGNIFTYEELGCSPEFISVKNGRALIIGVQGQQLQEIYIADLKATTGEGHVRRLTHFSHEALRDLRVGVPQPLAFSERQAELEGGPGPDGLQGWVLLPADFAPGRNYPAILEIHGGPKTVYGPVFHHEMQLLAAAGYLVFFCNPRGSDGRGDEFADIRGGYGDYRELMAFTDRVLEQYPCIDRHRIGVTGGSYGGFMTNWIIGHTDRFAAAVSQRSMANMVTMKTTTDIGHYSILDHQRADISRNFEDLWKQSPIRYAYRAVTPTLFIHSDEDHRCWQVEGMQMFAELKVHGVDTKLCLFRRENHELSRKGRPSSRIRRLRELLEWMDRYLKK